MMKHPQAGGGGGGRAAIHFYSNHLQPKTINAMCIRRVIFLKKWIIILMSPSGHKYNDFVGI